MDREILCISLPPAKTLYPLAGMVAVSSYLKSAGFIVDQLYLNVLFSNNSIWSSSTGDSNYDQVLPFLYLYNSIIIEEKEKAEIVKESMISRGTIECSQFDSYISTIYRFLTDTLRDCVEKNYKLICFSSKYHQWICAEVCSYIVRQLRNNVAIYIGGQYTMSESENILKICPNIDYSGWGEGEIPLALLAEHILKGKSQIHSIPRLVYRDSNDVIPSKASVQNSFISFSDNIYFDFDDYIVQKWVLDDVVIPIERSRKCTWNRCKFCFLTQGYKYRIKNTENIIKEIKYYIEKYKLYKFQFFDNNFVGADLNDFELLLDNLMSLKSQYPSFHIVFAEIVTHGLTSKHIRKMRDAGLTDLQIGFEALSGRSLHRFMKQQTLAENLFFLKEALYYGILPSGNNIIINCPDENRAEIVESIENLSYLRFMFMNPYFSIQMPELMIANYSAYMKEVRDSGQTYLWNNNRYYPLLPESVQNRIDRFSIFSFTADSVENHDLWRQFQETYEAIKGAGYRYIIQKKLDEVHFCEYRADTLIVDYVLNAFEKSLLTRLNIRCYKINDICEILSIDRSELLAQAKNMFDLKIVFYSEYDDNICSIIHFEELG